MSRSIQELQMLQALPLEVKVEKTKQRIREWVDEFGLDGVYVSFSGGKDSTVLLTIARQIYPEITAVFVDTGLEYPEVREFVKKFDNVEWLKPKKNFRQVIKDYGYPFIGKEVAERVYYAQKYLTWYEQECMLDRPTDRPSLYAAMELCGVERRKEKWKAGQKGVIPDEVKILLEFAESGEKGNYKVNELTGVIQKGRTSKTMFDYSKWVWMALCPYMISQKCCDVMKKAPAHSYQKRTGRKMMSGQMASESRLRSMQWLHNGCNGFNLKTPVSNPMAFWTEQDVLSYIYTNKIEIAPVYGEVVVDHLTDDDVEGQMSIYDIQEMEMFDLNRPTLKTTGCKRTGCMFCGFGCHLEKSGEGRFEKMKKTHPKQYEYIMKPTEQGGLGYKEVIDWINENGNIHIGY